MGKKCCFTGHRPEGFFFGYHENHPACLLIKRFIREAILKSINDGYDYFISRMAEGVDQWAAEIVIELRDSGYPIQLECLIPGKNQDKKWSQESKERYKSIISKCDVRKDFSDRICTAYILLSSDEWMVDRVDRVIAVYNGSPTGGTKHTYFYAYKNKKEIIRINPALMKSYMIEYPDKGDEEND